MMAVRWSLADLFPSTHSAMPFEQFVLEHEVGLRAAAFAIVFAAVAALESWLPRRRTAAVAKRARWTHNLLLAALNTLLLRLFSPVAAAGVAVFAAAHGWGLLNHFALPYAAAVVVAVVALDFAIWLQHVMLHAVPALWRLHRVHHADLDFDLTTGTRFHPIEILASTLVKFAAILVLGPPVLAVVVFEILLNATSMFGHGNVRLPDAVDRGLRWIVVTPDMHRIHHSVEDDETNSNFGFNLPWWDRLFGTYRAVPRAGHEAMTLGIHGHTDPREVARLPGMLRLPFVGAVDDYAINRRDWRERQAMR
jgi:sterol desaturase/sphingolipid hydroxylase (fatty acid hydroxylase superfamily)